MDYNLTENSLNLSAIYEDYSYYETQNQRDFTSELFNIVERTSKEKELNGALIIAKSKDIIFSHADGYERENNRIDLNTQFMIASVSKQFTVAATLKALYEINASDTNAVKEALNLPLSYYLPADHHIWQNQMPEWANQVTLHHLLSNRSGIADHLVANEDGKLKLAETSKLFHQDYEIINITKDKQLAFTPGTNYNYSNTNYFLLTKVIESVSGKSYQNYLEENIFSTTGMSSSYNPVSGNYYDIKTDEYLTRLAEEYLYNTNHKDIVSPNFFMDFSNAQGSGSIISTANDLLKWNIALHIDKTILPTELYNVMITDHSSDVHEEYGYGITVSNSGTVFAHTGGIDSYQSLLYYHKTSETSLIILSSLKEVEDGTDIATLGSESSKGFAGFNSEIFDFLDEF